MADLQLTAQIKSLRAQLDTLDAKLRFANGNPESFGDLRGLLSEEANTSAEEIRAARYRGPDDLEA